jgi:hypothetical protein
VLREFKRLQSLTAGARGQLPDAPFFGVAALEPPDAADVTRGATVLGKPLTVVHGLDRQPTHCAWHAGRIDSVAKPPTCGTASRTVSIRVGSLADFNRNPAPVRSPAGAATQSTKS